MSGDAVDRLEAALAELFAAEDAIAGTVNFYIGPSARTAGDPTRYNRWREASKAVRAALARLTEPRP